MRKLRKGLDGFKECLIRRNTNRINLSTFKIKLKLILIKVKTNVGGYNKIIQIKIFKKGKFKMKKILFLLVMLFCSFIVMADFEDEPIQIHSGYCEGGKRVGSESDGDINVNYVKYNVCKINGLKYRNIKVGFATLSDGSYRNFKPNLSHQNLNSCMRIDYDRRIIMISYYLGAYPDGCNGIERERR